MEKMNKRAAGASYERRAAAFLRGKGYQILAQNYRCRLGEIDLIAGDGGTIVFIEVKYRAGKGAGAPEEAVTAAKMRKIVRVAQYYCIVNHISENSSFRFDVIAIEGEELRHIENAFGAQGAW